MDFHRIILLGVAVSSMVVRSCKFLSMYIRSLTHRTRNSNTSEIGKCTLFDLTHDTVKFPTPTPITLPIQPSTMVHVKFYFCRTLLLSLDGEKGKEHRPKLIDHVMLSLLEQLCTLEPVGQQKSTPMIAPLKSGLDCWIRPLKVVP